MEDKLNTQPNLKPILEHSFTLVDRKRLTITGVEKVISVKPDLLQLKTNAGDMIVTGQDIEVTKLDLEQHSLNLNGKFDSIKYVENNKKPLLKKIFKWYFLALISCILFVWFYFVELFLLLFIVF